MSSLRLFLGVLSLCFLGLVVSIDSLTHSHGILCRTVGVFIRCVLHSVGW